MNHWFLSHRRQHARDKDKLQTLILELDQYVKDMDSEPQQQQQQYRAGVSECKNIGHLFIPAVHLFT